MTLILTASDLEQVIDMPSTIAAVEQVFADTVRGSARQPDPVAMTVPAGDSHFIVMPSLASTQQASAVKLLADIPSNAERGLPSQRSTLLLSDYRTGESLAILDGRVPTRVRTAAASAVASRHLARADASVLGLVGAGALAVAHVEALVHVLPLRRVVVWSRTRERVEQFRQAVAHHGLRVEAADDVASVFAVSDVVCTLTPSVEPLVKGAWFRAGQHINAVGARPRPTEREIDAEGLARADVYVDHRGTVAAKSGDYLLAVGERGTEAIQLRGELGEVVAGSVPGRGHQGAITLFNSVGIGLQDLAVGRLAYDRARERGLGCEIDLSA
ncbi:ornithine cyclodeaminase family protein [Zhihengliuella flava]|uniref:Ornithine cyclodeaminase/alanine dehydrogenase n=1 Tax=Zhihengliuella flava TaxID=1285193 RepID=A0A931GL42_9MICC|nr:ornithine cyclodeaminase family protein [Zhihengliuella flava]MBG6084109.1 ornithine cyclodeaminase/alanine dehydrogenase [Zhihengliuella flava]